MLNAGWYRVVVTPPIGTYLAGYNSRTVPAQGIHDDLYGRCLVLESASGAVAVLTVDVLQLPAAFTDHVRAQVARATGIPREQILVCATHTHAGPDLEGPYTPGGPDRCLGEMWQRALVGCAQAAWHARIPARVRVAVGTIDQIGVNRRHADGQPVDPRVGVISAHACEDGRAGVLVNYTCHPVVLGPDNVLVSADYPGYALRAIEAAAGPEVVTMFTNGAEGDVNTGHSADLSGIGAPIPGRTFERAQRLGQRLAGEVLKVLAGPATELGGPIAAMTRDVELPFRDVPALADAEAALAAADRDVASLLVSGEDTAATTAAKIRRFHAEVDLGVARQRLSTREACVSAELQALRVGDLALVGVPGELFVELGLAVKARSPFPYTVIVGLANGSVGYLPTQEACDAGGYETVATRFRPGTGEMVRDTCISMLHSLKEAAT